MYAALCEMHHCIECLNSVWYTCCLGKKNEIFDLCYLLKTRENGLPYIKKKLQFPSCTIRKLRKGVAKILDNKEGYRVYPGPVSDLSI